MCITDEEFNAIKTIAEYATRKELEKEISDLKLENLKLREDIVDLKAKNKLLIKKLKEVKERVEKLKKVKERAEANKESNQDNGVDYRAMCAELKKKNNNLERLIKFERAKKGKVK